MEEDKKNMTKRKGQLTIDGMVDIERIPMSSQFTREGALDAIAKFVACDDQALAVVEKPIFRNCLIAMRPKTTRNDLPSIHNLEVHIHNEFGNWLKTLKNDILVSKKEENSHVLDSPETQEAPGKISATADGWTADNTKGSFLGMTAHWIEVKDKKWNMRSEVVGFQPVSGDHSGWNLGRYFVGLCDRVGIFNKDGSKVVTIY
jgi:hypothetical protein